MPTQEITLALAFLRKRPESAASILEQHDVRDIVPFLSQIPASYGSSVIKCMIPHFAARICKTLPPLEAANMLVPLEANQISNILRHLDKQRRQDLLQGMPSKTKRICSLLLSYSQNTIGAWVTNHSEAIPIDCSIEEATKHLINATSKNQSGYAYIVDRENNFTGRIHYVDILKSNPTQKLETLVEKNCLTLKGRTQVSQAIEDDGWATADTLPVINKKGHFIGPLCHMDLRKASAFLSSHTTQAITTPALDNNLHAYGDALLSCFQAMGDLAEADTRA